MVQEAAAAQGDGGKTLAARGQFRPVRQGLGQGGVEQGGTPGGVGFIGQVSQQGQEIENVFPLP